VAEAIFWRCGGKGRICGGRQALELAADSREAAPRQGAHRTTPNPVDVKSPTGVKHDGNNAGGGSQPQERYVRSSGGGPQDPPPPE
jgi:hypothetical protein